MIVLLCEDLFRSLFLSVTTLLNWTNAKNKTHIHWQYKTRFLHVVPHNKIMEKYMLEKCICMLPFLLLFLFIVSKNLPTRVYVLKSNNKKSDTKNMYHDSSCTRKNNMREGILVKILMAKKHGYAISI